MLAAGARPLRDEVEEGHAAGRGAGVVVAVGRGGRVVGVVGRCDRGGLGPHASSQLCNYVHAHTSLSRYGKPVKVSQQGVEVVAADSGSL